MNRRHLIGLTLALVARPIGSAHAQVATPSPQHRKLGDYMGDAVRPDKAVVREFEDAGIGAWSSLTAFAMEFSNGITSGEMDIFVERLIRAQLQIDFLNRPEGSQIYDYQQSAVRPLGDEYWAFSGNSFPDEDIYRGVLLVRKDTQLQFIRGVPFTGNSIPDLAEIATDTVDRWPSNSLPIENITGWTGGIWDALPTLADVPEGMQLAFERETDEFDAP